MSEDYSRKNDRIIAQVEQKLTDHMLDFAHTKQEMVEWQQHHVEWCKAEVSRIEISLTPIQSAFKTFETPVRWIGWIVVGTLAGSLVWIGNHLAQWISRHWG